MVTWNNSQQSSSPLSTPVQQDTSSSPIDTLIDTQAEPEASQLSHSQDTAPCLSAQPEPEINSPVPSLTVSAGTWQPQLTSSTGAVSIRVKFASYTMIDTLVTAFFDLSLVDFNQLNASEVLEITNLPFVSAAQSAIVGGGVLYYFTHVRSNISDITGTVLGNTATLQLWRSIGQSRLNRLTVNDLQNISTLAGQIQYVSQ